jgi:8-oxo-dGTP pyrophosphatase MutT (NUDIX family)
MNEPAPNGARVPVRPAATVMLVRDAVPAGVEVLMLRRHVDSVFAAGAWVFPGGRVDPDDALLAPHLGPFPTDAAASTVLGIPSGGLAFWVASLRECFEEAGILLALDRRTGRRLDMSDDLVAARLARHRRELLAGERSLADILTALDVVLDVGSVHPVSHWITPPGPPRRFDTRFFVAPAPPGQDGSHDTNETVDSVWTRPAAVLERYAAGAATLVFPTIKQLQALARYPSAGDVLAAARSVRPSFRGALGEKAEPCPI